MGKGDAKKDSDARENIGLFGGSFNPAHNGHISIAESFVRSPLLDKLWVLLTPQPPHKSDRLLADYSDRFEMLKLAFQNHPNIEVSNVENELPRPTYTLKTIEYIKQQYPDKKFYLCLGSDSLQDFHKWYKYRRILDEVDLLVAQRPGEEIDDVDLHVMEKTHLVNHDPIDLSSTAIREWIRKGDHPEDWIPESVYKYIKQKNLYKK